MKRIENISLLGLGAIGGAYAGMFCEMDPQCLKIIADKERSERYQQQGLLINDKLYHFTFVQPEEHSVPADLILIAVKYHDLQQAIRDISSHVGPETVILSLLNGISSEEIIGREYGMDKLLYAVSVGMDAVREGRKIRFSSPGKIVFGEKTNIVHSARVKAVKNLLDRAKIPYAIPENMIRVLWWKFMANVGYNQASAVLKAPYRVFQEVREAKELVRLAMLEVIDLSEQAGINLNEQDLFEIDQVLRTFAPDGKTSMLQDLEAGRKTEVEMFAGTVCELGRRYGVCTPVSEVLFKMIRTLEQMSSF